MINRVIDFGKQQGNHLYPCGCGLYDVLVLPVLPERSSRGRGGGPGGRVVRQYQVNVDPNRLQAYNLSISRVAKAVQGGRSKGRITGSGQYEAAQRVKQRLLLVVPLTLLRNIEVLPRLGKPITEFYTLM